MKFHTGNPCTSADALVLPKVSKGRTEKLNMWRQKQSEMAPNDVKPAFLNLFSETSGISPIPETGLLCRCDVRPWMEFDLDSDSFLLFLKAVHEALGSPSLSGCHAFPTT
jgi:hypothetical protein